MKNNTTTSKLEELSKLISTSSNIPYDKIVISSIVLGQDNYWRWLYYPKSDGCSNIIEILKNSTFLIRDNIISYYYCNDKEKAIKENKYYPDQRDIVFDCVGSFILLEAANKTEETNDTIELNLPRKTIVCISTYGTKIIGSSDETKIKEFYSDVTDAVLRCSIFD